MDDVWPRIKQAISKKPGGAGREMAWLAEQLNSSIQRVKNWEARGVPSSAYPQIAEALGWSVDAVAGRSEPPMDHWPFKRITREQLAALSDYDLGVIETRMRDALRELSGESSTGTGTFGM